MRSGRLYELCTMGLGYIGLPTSLMFAKHGVDVVGVDMVPEIVDTLNSGHIHIEEPGLAEMLSEVVAKGKFRASLTPEEADVFYNCVLTPNNDDEYKSCDLTYVLNATKQVLPFCKKRNNLLLLNQLLHLPSMEDFVAPLVEKEGFKVGEDVLFSSLS